MIRDLRHGPFQAKVKSAPTYIIAINKIFSIFFILILLFYLMRPALTYLEYLLYKNYISEYLCIMKDVPDNCCQGKCYLEEQLKKNAEPNDADWDTGKKIIQVRRVEDYILAEVLMNKPAGEKILMKRFYSERIIESSLSPVFVPPKFNLGV
jgi:hypothetical protein